MIFPRLFPNNRAGTDADPAARLLTVSLAVSQAARNTHWESPYTRATTQRRYVEADALPNRFGNARLTSAIAFLSLATVVRP